MKLLDILKRDSCLPTTIAVNLIVQLDIVQNGYDGTDKITNVIERNTRNLHDKIKSDWTEEVLVDGPIGKRQIRIIEYLGDDFSTDEFNYHYAASAINFLKLVERFNKYRVSCGGPEIHLETSAPQDPASGNLLIEFTSAISQIVRNITTQEEKYTNKLLEDISEDCLHTLMQTTLVSSNAAAIVAAIDAELNEFKTKGKVASSVRAKMIESAIYLSEKYKEKKVSDIPNLNDVTNELNKLNNGLAKPHRKYVAEAYINYRKTTPHK